MYDYVLDKSYESGSAYYLAQNWKNIAFENLNFTGKVNIESSQPENKIDGVSFVNCSFTTEGTASTNGASLRYYNENNNQSIQNLTVDNCTFSNCFQGIYTQQIRGITVTNSNFTNTGHNAIAIQTETEKGAVNHGSVVITNNTFNQIGDRILRLGDVGADTQFTIANNTATNSGDTAGEVIKATTIAAGVTANVYGNNWGEGKTVVNAELQEKELVAQIGEAKYTSLASAVAAAESGDTVKLLKDVEITGRTDIRKDFILDLDNHKITDTSEGWGLVCLNSNVTIQNGTISSTSYGALYVASGNVTAKKLFIDTSASNGGSGNAGATTGVYMAGGTFTLEKDSTIKSNEVGIFTLKQSVTNVYGKVETISNYLSNGVNYGYAAIQGNGTDKTAPGTTINIYDGAVVTAGAHGMGIYHPQVGNLTISGGEISGATGIGIKSGTLNITGGKISGTFKDTYKEPTSATNGINGDGSAVLVDSYIDYAGSMNINISGNAVLESKVGHAIREIGNDDGKTNVVTLKITDGKFKAGSGMDAVKVRDVTKNTVEISKGIFSSDPSAYCVDEKTGVANTDSGTNREYPFMVGEAGQTLAEVVVAAPKVDVADTLKNNELAGNAASALATKDSNAQAKVEGATTAAANTIANQNKVDETAAKKALTDAEINVADNQKVNVIVQQYLDIRITDATSDRTDTTTTKTLTLDITPMYRKVATTANPDATDNSEIVVKGIDDQGSGDAQKTANAVTLESGELNAVGLTTVTLPLPSDFTNETALNVEHLKSAAKTYIYKGSIDTTATSDAGQASANGVQILTFNNPNGFSLFKVGSETKIVAEIDGVGYPSLQAAVDEVQDGQTITLKESGEATVSRTVTFNIKAENSATATITSGSRTTVNQSGPDENGVTTYTCTRSSGGSGGGVTTYAINTNSPANGTVTASPKSAAKDATVTLTVTPTEGYQLDKLTVVDKDGKEIALTDKGDGKYTFVMPASKVDVTATFKQAPATHVCPSEKYTDVDTTQWYHEGVDYVIENGMMNGTGTNTFEPNATTTRGMIVTILYRLEKEPAAGASPFTDVDAGQWYAKAVAWAAANGVVNGTSPTTFNPNDPITREQMAAILYRYASFKGYDVTGKADLAGYTDAAQISDYAKDAMAWANQEGLIGGVSANTLQPQGSATRAQVATILMRFCENVAK